MCISPRVDQCCDGQCHTTTTPITEILSQDITCAIDIGILTMTTTTGVESATLTIGLLSHSTSRTGLGSVLFGDGHDFDADKFGFVLDELSNFAKVPRMQLLVVTLSVVDAITDSSEITNDDGINLLIFAEPDEVLTNDMEAVIDLSRLFTLNLLVTPRRFSLLFAWRLDLTSYFLPVPFSGFDLSSTDNHRVSISRNCGNDVIESKIDGDYVREEGCLIRRDINRTDQMGVVVPSSSIVGQLDNCSSHRVNVFSEGNLEGNILDAIVSFRSAGQPKIKASILFDDFECGLEVGNWRKAMFWTKSRGHGVCMPVL